MRIAVLLNDRIALPALHYLSGTGQLAAVGLPDRKSETGAVVKKMCAAGNVACCLFSKNSFDSALLQWLDTVKPDVVFVKTFPFLISAEALAVPAYGFINFHYAPLPAWRGPHPLFWMLRKGEKTGGISVHRMSAAYDAGPLLLEVPMPIAEGVSFGMLNTQLAYLGLEVTKQLIPNLEAVLLQQRPQDEVHAKWYGRPQPADLFIDWRQMEATEITALVRACNPWNKGAGTRWKEWTFGITWASVLPFAVDAQILPGTILSLNPTAGFTIACKDGKGIAAEIVYCEEGFYPGHFLRVFGLAEGDRLF